MQLSAIIRDSRKKLGLTQTDLATLASVSLPNIQRIEAGVANPSLATLQGILNVLGREIQFGLRPVDWDKGAALGIPVQSMRTAGIVRNRENLMTFLKLAAWEVTESKDSRKKDALSATLCALKIHYPSIYVKEIQPCPLFDPFLKTLSEGRVIKLYRIALAQLSRYL